MNMENMMNVVCSPFVTVGEYITAFKNGPKQELIKLEEKPVVVEKKPLDEKEIALNKMWETAEKVGDVVVDVLTHPLTKKLVKNVVSLALDKVELGAMEKAVDVLGDKILPGDVPAIKLAFMLINGLSKIAKN